MSLPPGAAGGVVADPPVNSQIVLYRDGGVSGPKVVYLGTNEPKPTIFEN